MRIRCCKDCIPPKRHINCHATCKEYLEEKAEIEANKKKRGIISQETEIASYKQIQINKALHHKNLKKR